MKETRSYFTQDSLLHRVRTRLIASLRVNKTAEIADTAFSNIDCLMSALSVFTFKFPSLLKFDKARTSDKPLKKKSKNPLSYQKCPL